MIRPYATSRAGQDNVIEPAIQRTSAATRDQLSWFGELMINEVLQRTSALDSKAQNAIGWTSAMLAVLLALSPGALAPEPTTLQLIVLTIGVLSATCAILAAGVALRLIDLNWPSQTDWFCKELFGSLGDLQTYHLLALLNTHEAHSRANERKAWWLRVSQYGLIAAGIALGLLLIVPTWLR